MFSHFVNIFVNICCIFATECSFFVGRLVVKMMFACQELLIFYWSCLCALLADSLLFCNCQCCQVPPFLLLLPPGQTRHYGGSHFIKWHKTVLQEVPVKISSCKSQLHSTQAKSNFKMCQMGRNLMVPSMRRQQSNTILHPSASF